MSEPCAGIRAVIFDLDGTLYDDTHHFDYYARLLQAALPEARRATFWADYQAACAGRHALRVGRLYDRRRDWVLTCTGGRVTAARTWDGTPVPAPALHRAYTGPVAVDHLDLLNVGDLWWVPAACAAHHGLDPAAQASAFLAVREWMSGPDFTLAGTPGLRETLLALGRRGVARVLATNSPQPDSEVLLAKAGLAGTMDRCFFRCNKPAGMAAVVEAVCAAHSLRPPQVLSVGDNYVNDIAPARALGCHTVYLDVHGTAADEPCDQRLPGLQQLLPWLRNQLPGTGGSGYNKSHM